MNIWNTIKRKINSALRYGSGYTGASNNRRLFNWQYSTGSPDGEIIIDLPALRFRSRDLFKNNPIARGAIQLMVNNVVGRGLKLQSSIDRDVIFDYYGDTPEINNMIDAAEKKIEKRFRLWAESPSVDTGGKHNFYEIQNLAYKSVLTSGEVFVLYPLRRHRQNNFSLKLGLIESDQVQTPMVPVTNQNRDGVVTSPFGEEIGYWVNRNQEQNPIDMVYFAKFGSSSKREQVVHLFKSDRPGQSRGVPFLTPVLDSLKSLDRYQKSEMTAAEISSKYTAFITSEDSNILSNNLTPTVGQDSGDAQRDGENLYLGDGVIMQLLPNEKIEFANPARPHSAYGSFVESKLQEIGSALGIPFEMLIKHFTASFSASRAARLEFEKTVRIEREWIELRLCVPTFTEFLINEVAAGNIDLPGFFDSQELTNAYCGSTWDGESMGLMDPKSEIEAAQLRIQLGFSTATEESRELTGNDYETNLIIQKREKFLREKLKNEIIENERVEKNG